MHTILTCQIDFKYVNDGIFVCYYSLEHDLQFVCVHSVISSVALNMCSCVGVHVCLQVSCPFLVFQTDQKIP